MRADALASEKAATAHPLVPVPASSETVYVPVSSPFHDPPGGVMR